MLSLRVLIQSCSTCAWWKSGINVAVMLLKLQGDDNSDDEDEKKHHRYKHHHHRKDYDD